MKYLVFPSVFAVLLFATGSAAAKPEGLLKRAGALECQASAGATSGAEKVTDLKCVLRLRHNDKSYFVSGQLHGSALYLLEGGIRVYWSVLSPTANLRPGALEGDYDTTSKFDFKYVRERTNILVGGMDDTVALQLVEPVLDAINPSVRLTLAAPKATSQ